MSSGRTSYHRAFVSGRSRPDSLYGKKKRPQTQNRGLAAAFGSHRYSTGLFAALVVALAGVAFVDFLSGDAQAMKRDIVLASLRGSQPPERLDANGSGSGWGGLPLNLEILGLSTPEAHGAARLRPQAAKALTAAAFQDPQAEARTGFAKAVMGTQSTDQADPYAPNRAKRNVLAVPKPGAAAMARYASLPSAREPMPGARLEATPAPRSARAAEPEARVVPAALKDVVSLFRGRTAADADTADMAAIATAAAPLSPLTHIVFSGTDAQLTQSTRTRVAEMAPLLARTPVPVIVLGYGGAQNDMSLAAYGLSRQRAETVKAALVSHGIAPEQVEIRAMGGAKERGALAQRVEIWAPKGAIERDFAARTL